MSRRDPLVYIHQMQDYAIEARDLAAGRSRNNVGCSQDEPFSVPSGGTSSSGGASPFVRI